MTLFRASLQRHLSVMLGVAQLLVPDRSPLVESATSEHTVPVFRCGEACHIQHHRPLYSHVQGAPI